jgi:hypothetical protein
MNKTTGLIGMEEHGMALTDSQIADMIPAGFEILPPGAEHVEGTRYLKGLKWVETDNVAGNNNGSFIHIRPVPGWWLDMATMQVHYAIGAPTATCLDITAGYAMHLVEAPQGGPWTLGKVEAGDYFAGEEGRVVGPAATPFVDNGPDDRGVRWRRPGREYGWVEIDVRNDEPLVGYQFSHPDHACSPGPAAQGICKVRWTDAETLEGYGGTLFEGSTAWTFRRRRFRPEGCDGYVQARPLKVRYRREIPPRSLPTPPAPPCVAPTVVRSKRTRALLTDAQRVAARIGTTKQRSQPYLTGLGHPDACAPEKKPASVRAPINKYRGPRHKNPKAVKQYRCCECGGLIRKGTKYHYYRGNASAGTGCKIYRSCADCETLRGDICRGLNMKLKYSLARLARLCAGHFEKNPEWAHRFEAAALKRGGHVPGWLSEKTAAVKN